MNIFFFYIYVSFRFLRDFFSLIKKVTYHIRKVDTIRAGFDAYGHNHVR